MFDCDSSITCYTNRRLFFKKKEGNAWSAASFPRLLTCPGTQIKQRSPPPPPLYQSLNRESRWGTTDYFATSFPFFSVLHSLWELPNSRPVHSLMLSSHLFLCLPCLLPPFTVPCKMVLARPNERETWPYHCSLRLFTIVRRYSCGPIACWILARASSW